MRPQRAGFHSIEDYCYRAMQFLILGMLLAFLFTGCDNPRDGRPGSLVGVWYAQPEFRGATGRVGLEFSRDGKGGIVAQLSLIDIEAYGLPIGAVTRIGDRVRAGPIELTHDASERTLRGVLPEEIVPVHEIPVLFRQVDKLARPAPARDDFPSPEPVWKFAADGPIWAGLSYDGGVVYAGSDDGNVYALKAGNGSEVWRFATGGAVRARPMVHGGTVLVQSDDGYLYRLDARDGSVRWRARLQDSPIERLGLGDEGFLYDHYASSTTIVDGVVFVGCATGEIHAIDLVSGDRLWRFATGRTVTSTPAVVGSTVFVGSFDGHLYALDASAGDPLWRVDTGAPIASSPVTYEDLVLIGSRSYELLGLRSTDGEIVWRRYQWFSWVESTATIRDGMAYIGTSDGQRLFAYDAKNGTLLWELDTGGSAWSQPAVSESTVFQGTVGVADYLVEHRAALFAVDRTTGAVLWKFPLERPAESVLWGFGSSPVVGDGRVFVGATDGQIYAFESDANSVSQAKAEASDEGGACSAEGRGVPASRDRRRN